MRRRFNPAAPMSALLAVAIAAGVIASPQDRQQIMIMDDGGGPMVMAAIRPDIRALATPDFVRDDLPLFNRKLDLNELQRIVVETLLSAYLEQFDALVTEKLPGARGGEGQVQVLAHDGGPPGAGAPMDMVGAEIGVPEGIDEIVRSAIGRRDDDGLVGFDGFDIEDDAPVDRIAIAITADDGAPGGPGGPGAPVNVPGPGAEPGEEGGAWATPGGEVFMPAQQGEVVVAEAGSGEDGAPRASVVISVGGPESAELPEEVRRQLEEKAAQMAEEIRQRVEENREAGLDPFAGHMAPQERIEQMQARMQEMSEQADEFTRAKQALKVRFVSDVQSQLAPDQLERWPSLDRALTRRKTLPQGRLDGERTDLTRLAERIGLAQAEADAIAGVLEAYEIDLHTALTARNEFLQTANAQIDQAIRTNETDEAIKIAGRAAGLRVAVRSVNLHYARQIAEHLAPPTDAEFSTVSQRVFFPRVYGRTRAMRTFQDARKLDGLEDNVRTAIDQLEAAYLQELGPINEQLRRTIESNQPEEPKRSLENLKAMMEGAGPLPGHEDDPIHKAMRARSARDEAYMKQLYALLSAEQIEALPRLPSQRNAPTMFFQLGN